MQLTCPELESTPSPDYDTIGAVREAERQVKGKHLDLRGKDMSAPKWV